MTILFTIVASFIFDTAGTVIKKSTRFLRLKRLQRLTLNKCLLRCNVMFECMGQPFCHSGGILYCGFKLGIKDHVILPTARMGFEIVTTTWAAIK